MTERGPVYGESLTSEDTFDLTVDDLDHAFSSSDQAAATSANRGRAGGFDLKALLQQTQRAERAQSLVLAMVVERDAAPVRRAQLARRRVRGW